MNLDYLFDLKNKEFIFECIQIMRKNKLFDEETLSILTNREICNQKFGMQYSILEETPIEDPIPKNMFRDNCGNRRYYPDIININNRRFIVCNDWYYKNKVGRDNRTPFVDWISKTINKHRL